MALISNNVYYVDVIFSLAARLIRAATDRQVEVKEELLRHILDFTKEVSDGLCPVPHRGRAGGGGPGAAGSEATFMCRAPEHH
jgi:hypothetical protein